MISLYQVTAEVNRNARLANKGCSFDYGIGMFDPIANIGAYVKVAELAVNDLDDAFQVGNIGPEHRITRLAPMHSVSVGDILVHEGKTFIVASFGFDELDVVMEG